MKQKLKRFLLLSLLTGTLFVSCELQEEAIHNHEHDSNKIFKLEKVKFNEFSKNSNLIKKINKVKSKLRQNENNRIVASTDGNFTINTDYAIYLQTGINKHSYTFKINRENPQFLLENLILNSNDSLGYEAYIVQYNINEYEYQSIKNDIPIDLSNKMTLIKVNDSDFISNILSKETYEIQTMCLNSVTTCGSGQHWGANGSSGNLNDCDIPGTFSTFYSWNECTVSIPTGGGGTGGTGSGGGGGSTTGAGSNYDGSDTSIHGNGSNTVNTTPMLELEEIPLDPCEKIKKLQADTNFKNRMALLIDAARGWSFEKCHVMYNAVSPSITNNYTYENFQGTISSPESGYTGNTNMQGIIHSHYRGLISIFSAGDLQDLYFKLKNYPDITDDFFMGVVTSSNTAYLLQVPDRATFIAFGDKYLADNDKISYFMKDIMLEKYNINPDNSRTDNELGFLKMMANLNMGVSLASVDFNATTPATGTVFNTWTKKVYDKKTRTVISSNCN